VPQALRSQAKKRSEELLLRGQANPLKSTSIYTIGVKRVLEAAQVEVKPQEQNEQVNCCKQQKGPW
jgi:hypothetical protein